MRPILASALLIATINSFSAPCAGQEASDKSQISPILVKPDAYLREEASVGPNDQPEWTIPRRFATTRVYVLPEWHVETELGWRIEWPGDGTTEHRLQEEIEIGLPHRFQLDIENADDFQGGSSEHAFNALELRYAFADWDVIPLNPTLNVEWKFDPSAADAFELQLLTGGSLTPLWHWGSDLFFENQIGDDERREVAWSAALSYVVIDSCLSAGLEFKAATEWDEGPDDAEYEILLGPSVQWRPFDRVHVDLVPLAGLGADSPDAQTFVFIGVDFGKESDSNKTVEPASLRGR